MPSFSDTKLLAKTILSELISLAPKFYEEIHGRRALLYPLVSRSPKHFTPATIAILASTDPIRATTSKKDEAVRRDEVRKACSEGLLSFVTENAPELIIDAGGSLVVTEIMLHASGGMSTSSS